MKTIGSLIDDMHANREARKHLEAQIKTLKSAYEEMELQLMDTMQEIDVSAVKGSKAAARISELTVPTIHDWNAAVEHIIATNSTHLLQRKINSVGYRELLNMGEDIPGVSPFTKRSISLISL